MPSYKVRVEGKEYDVQVVDAGRAARVTVAGKTFEVEPIGVVSSVATRPEAVVPSVAPATPRAAAPAPAGSGVIQAPIPGVVTRICVSAGQKVERGDVVLKLEAMKMENDITAPVSGTVKEIAVQAGSEVRDGQLLAVVE